MISSGSLRGEGPPVTPFSLVTGGIDGPRHMLSRGPTCEGLYLVMGRVLLRLINGDAMLPQ
ncbi:hypothetical protein GW17_00043167 [Ensete ventricosum]|nr:hypothetical protein GW17_00043167 [Ensete ventricosum]